ncbi:hypothetical protein AB833_29975 [Chromatiales bacterium (ex Bugula neritina AB1)]|nr:hypothetical protein AB833_29975 [Chromatiales bacterium (ex Bugula neritina AB1)]
MIHFSGVTKIRQNRALLANLNLFLPRASYTWIKADADTAIALQRLTMAYDKPDSGTLTVDGVSITDIPATRIPFLRRRIGLVESHPVLFENRTVKQNIELPLQVAEFNTQAITDRIEETLDCSGLSAIADIQVQNLDESNRRLVACARATVHRPAIVLVHEAVRTDNSAQTAEEALLTTAHQHASSIIKFGEHQPLALPSTKSLSLTITQGQLDNYGTSAAAHTY